MMADRGSGSVCGQFLSPNTFWIVSPFACRYPDLSVRFRSKIDAGAPPITYKCVHMSSVHSITPSIFVGAGSAKLH